MRVLMLTGLAASLALATACGGLSPPVVKGDTGQVTASGTAGGGTDDTGSTSSGAGSGNPAGGTPSGGGGGGDGGSFGSPSPTGAVTSCNLTQPETSDVAAVLTGVDWDVSIGGPIHTDVSTWAGALTPANEFWGAQITSSALNPTTMEGLSYGFAMDGSGNLINPAAPTPLTDSVLNNGLADGYYEVVTPYLLTIDASWSANHLPWAATMTISAYVAVDNDTLGDVIIDGYPLNSVLAFAYGDAAWDGDQQGTGNFCVVYLDLNGRTVTPN